MRSRAILAFSATLLAATSVIFGPTTAGAIPVSPTPSCGGVMQGGGDAQLTKELVSIVAVDADTFTITFRLTSVRDLSGAGQFRVRDCIFIDTGDPGYSGEAFIGGSDEKFVTFLPGPNGGSTVTIVETVDVAANATICDRAAVSGSLSVTDVTGFTDKSNVLCVPVTPGGVIPEVPYVVLLPLCALALFGGAYFVLRGRSRPAVL